MTSFLLVSVVVALLLAVFVAGLFVAGRLALRWLQGQDDD